MRRRLRISNSPDERAFFCHIIFIFLLDYDTLVAIDVFKLVPRHACCLHTFMDLHLFRATIIAFVSKQTRYLLGLN